MKRSIFFIVAAIFALVGGGPTTLSSHALLQRAEPPINSQVREPPTVLTLHFNEPLERRFSNVRVTTPQNERLDERIEFDDSDRAVMRVYLTQPVKPNFLTVDWENVSTVDGHRITGSYVLTVLEADGRLPVGTPPDLTATTQGAGPDPLRVAIKFVLLIAGTTLTGALAFMFFIMPALDRTQSGTMRTGFNRLTIGIALGSVVVLAVFGFLELLSQAAELDSSISDVFATQWGQRWQLRNLALIPAALLVGSILVAGPKRAIVGLAFFAAAAYLAGTSSVSHSAAGAGAFWAAGSDFVHLLAASIWIGMLALLVVLFVRGGRELTGRERYRVLVSALQRFSIVAVVSVALLLFSGTFNSIVEVAHVGDLLDTDYGNALLAKLLLMLPLLVVGAANAYLFRPDLEDELEKGTQGSAQDERLAAAEATLQRTIRWELALAVGVLAIVALLVQLTPTRGRLNSSDTEGQFLGSFQEDGIAVTLEIDPREVGSNTFEVYLAGRIDTVEMVRLNFWPEGDSDRESRLILEPSNPPTFYLGQGANMSQAGEWVVQVFVRRAAGTGSDVTVPFKMEIAPPGGVITQAKQGGAFAIPVDFTVPSVAVMLASAVVSVGVVFVSVRRPGLTGGYGTVAAEHIADRLPTVRPAWSLIVLVVVGIGLGLLVGAHRHNRLSNQQATAGNPVEATQDSINRGQMLFQRNCMQCHGDTGRGDGPLAASLPLRPANLYEHIPFHPDAFFFNAISEGLGGIMPSFKDSISEEDRWNILNYLRATFTDESPTQ